MGLHADPRAVTAFPAQGTSPGEGVSATLSLPMSESLTTQAQSRFSPALLRRSLNDALELAHGVDAVAVEERAASLAKRSLKKESKVWGLNLAVSMIDLTTLEGKDTPGKVHALC